MEALAHRYEMDEAGVFGDADPFESRFDMRFEDFADAPLPDDAEPADAVSAAYASRLSWFLDEVTNEKASLAIQVARRARALDHARSWAMLSDEFVLPNAKLTEREREDWVMRVFLSEVATRLRLPESTAGRLVDESRMLVHELTHTLDALAAAQISYRHALVIIEQSRALPAHVRTSFEQSVLPDAKRLPVTQFRRRAVSTRERIHPDSIEERTRSAVGDRRFAFEADVDGMAWLHHLLPAPDARAIHTRVTDIAKSLQGEGEQRTSLSCVPTWRRSSFSTECRRMWRAVRRRARSCPPRRSRGGNGPSASDLPSSSPFRHSRPSGSAMIPACSTATA
jgi:hypothetical protein